MAPASGEKVNHFLKACDLGIGGAFIPQQLRITVTVDEDATPTQLQRQMPAIKAAYERLGWIDITIQEAK